jgi:hypothetical protein
MLIADGTVVVIGYSYERGGTEIGLFDLGPDGQLRYRATYQMRSNDYYSDRNYASRLIGHQLVFYSPLDINTGDPDPPAFMPALRRWYRGATPADFKRILPATRIYRGGVDLDLDEGVTLHSISLCDLDAPTMECKSTAVLGPRGRVFYVADDAVYVWSAPWSPSVTKPNASAVFRIPLDGTAPTGLRTSGCPIDQMSFLQRDGFLNVLVGSEADGEGMWAANSRSGELALLRLRMDQFGDGTRARQPQRLPAAARSRSGQCGPPQPIRRRLVVVGCRGFLGWRIGASGGAGGAFFGERAQSKQFGWATALIVSKRLGETSFSSVNLGPTCVSQACAWKNMPTP